MQQLVNFALEHRKDVVAIESSYELAKNLQATVPDWKNTAIEEIQQRIQDIMQDIIFGTNFFVLNTPRLQTSFWKRLTSN